MAWQSKPVQVQAFHDGMRLVHELSKATRPWHWVDLAKWDSKRAEKPVTTEVTWLLLDFCHCSLTVLILCCTCVSSCYSETLGCKLRLEGCRLTDKIANNCHEADQSYVETLENTGASKPVLRDGRGAASYSIRQLFEFMTVGINLRNQHRIGTVLQTAFHLISGNFGDFLTTISKDGVNLENSQCWGGWVWTGL